MISTINRSFNFGMKKVLIAYEDLVANVAHVSQFRLPYHESQSLNLFYSVEELLLIFLERRCPQINYSKFLGCRDPR